MAEPYKIITLTVASLLLLNQKAVFPPFQPLWVPFTVYTVDCFTLVPDDAFTPC